MPSPGTDEHRFSMLSITTGHTSPTTFTKCNSLDPPPRARGATATETPTLNKSSDLAPTSSYPLILVLLYYTFQRDLVEKNSALVSLPKDAKVMPVGLRR
mmetsp:Transcript_32408/g.102850  ORF Transcript_32408/g.102850 Transcript_32408/m.102850 type:complete len:100 (-) Transcript_32408:97-396(-)